MSAGPTAPSSDEPSRIIWLSDLHYEAEALVMGHDPRARLEAAIGFINERYSDAALCVISGDMVETATAQNYEAVCNHLNRLNIPWYPLTGNHDDAALMHAHLPLPGGAMVDHVQYVVDVAGARLICLDSLIPGAAAGRLCPDRLAWLEARLSEAPEAPTLIFVHHPPVALGLPMQDVDNLLNGGELLALLARYRAACHLFTGHVHRPVAGHVEGLSYTGINSVLFQAPPPVPAWDWGSFRPAREAPLLGVIDIRAGQVNTQLIPFCDAGLGAPSPE